MKKGQTQKSPAHENLNHLNAIMSLFKRFKNRLLADPVNLQLIASVAFILAVVAVVGSSHG